MGILSKDPGFLVLILLAQDLNTALGSPANKEVDLCSFLTLFKTYSQRAYARER